MTNYLAYKDTANDVVILFSKQLNSNRKIAPSRMVILNQFTFSTEQWEKVETASLAEFFTANQSNCLNCVYGGAKGKCYAQKFHSWMSYKHHIKGAKAQLNTIPEKENFDWNKLYKLAAKVDYTRFGVYGEPVFIPKANILELIKIQPNYTGYTHAWQKFEDYKDIFLASCNNISETFFAISLGWKPFASIKNMEELKGFEKKFVNCPASAESGKKSLCSICGLCRASKKGKPIYILEH
jgi:hypothetical protein